MILEVSDDKEVLDNLILSELEIENALKGIAKS